MNTETMIRDQYLPYHRVSALKDPHRFWYQNINQQVYIFDQVSGNIYGLKGQIASLFQARQRQEFSSILNSMTWDEVKSAYTIVDKISKSSSVNEPELKNTINSIHLDLSNQCNLACKYCFKDKKRYELKDWSIVTRSLDFLVYDCGKNASEYEIGYCYTSEPLLDFPNLKKLIVHVTRLSKTINKKISVFFNTNGTILSEEIIRYFNRISRQFNISIDGSQSVHDEVRRFANGKGTFSVIQANIQKLKELNYTLLGSSVLTAQYPYPAQVLNFLLDLGFDDVLMKPVRFGNGLSFDENNISGLKYGYEEYFHMFYQDLRNGDFSRIKKYMNDFPLRFFQLILFKQKKFRRCYWGFNKMSVNHRGEIFPCDSALNMADFKVGDIENGMDWSKYSGLLQVDVRGQCKSCWAKYICGGTCYVKSWLDQRDYLWIDPVECELNKFLIESSLRLMFQLIDEGFNLAGLREFYSVRPLR
jgi:uncharacterized protein